MPAPVASGWSGRRVGLAPTGKAPPCHGARGFRAFPICPAYDDGTGKSHLAIAIARSCIRGGARGRFYTTLRRRRGPGPNGPANLKDSPLEHPSAPPESAWPSGSSANAITRLGSPDSALEGAGFEASVPLVR